MYLYVDTSFLNKKQINRQKKKRKKPHTLFAVLIHCQDVKATVRFQLCSHPQFSSVRDNKETGKQSICFSN